MVCGWAQSCSHICLVRKDYTMAKSIRVILKTVRPLDSDYRVRSILVNEDDVLLAYDNVHNRNVNGIEMNGEFFIKHPHKLDPNESIIDISLDLYRWDMFVTTNTIDRMLIQNTDPTEHITVNPDRGYGQSIRIRHLVLVSQ